MTNLWVYFNEPNDKPILFSKHMSSCPPTGGRDDHNLFGIS